MELKTKKKLIFSEGVGKNTTSCGETTTTFFLIDSSSRRGGGETEQLIKNMGRGGGKDCFSFWGLGCGGHAWRKKQSKKEFERKKEGEVETVKWL